MGWWWLCKHIYVCVYICNRQPIQMAGWTTITICSTCCTGTGANWMNQILHWFLDTESYHSINSKRRTSLDDTFAKLPRHRYLTFQTATGRCQFEMKINQRLPLKHKLAATNFATYHFFINARAMFKRMMWTAMSQIGHLDSFLDYILGTYTQNWMGHLLVLLEVIKDQGI